MLRNLICSFFMLSITLFYSLSTQAQVLNAHQTGTQEGQLLLRSPYSTMETIDERFPQILRDQQDYQLAQETFYLDVPEHYDPQGEPFGLVVHVSPSPSGRLSNQGYRTALHERNLIYISAHNSGNQRNVAVRFGLALDAAYNLPLMYNIDPNRIYITGVSGGGRCSSMLASNFADVFTGAMPIIGCNHYQRLRVPSQPSHYFNHYPAPPQHLRRLSRIYPMVIITGSNDGNREQCEVYARAYERLGYQAVSYIEVEGMGHTTPPADVYAQGLTLLETRPEINERTQQIYDTLQERYENALNLLETNPTVAQRQLEQLAQRHLHTPAGRWAQLKLHQLQLESDEDF